jgi:hypothetical protein
MGQVVRDASIVNDASVAEALRSAEAERYGTGRKGRNGRKRMGRSQRQMGRWVVERRNGRKGSDSSQPKGTGLVPASLGNSRVVRGNRVASDGRSLKTHQSVAKEWS